MSTPRLLEIMAEAMAEWIELQGNLAIDPTDLEQLKYDGTLLLGYARVLGCDVTELNNAYNQALADYFENTDPVRAGTEEEL